MWLPDKGEPIYTHLCQCASYKPVTPSFKAVEGRVIAIIGSIYQDDLSDQHNKAKYVNRRDSGRFIYASCPLIPVHLTR